MKNSNDSVLTLSYSVTYYTANDLTVLSEGLLFVSVARLGGFLVFSLHATVTQFDRILAFLWARLTYARFI
jgi:hypothetical protein